MTLYFTFNKALIVTVLSHSFISDFSQFGPLSPRYTLKEPHQHLTQAIGTWKKACSAKSSTGRAEIETLHPVGQETLGGRSRKFNASTCVGKRSRASDTLCRAGRPFALPESPFTTTPPPPSPPPSGSDEGESWPEVSHSISLTQGGFRSTWKSAEILQLLETSKRARLMKNGST